MAVSDYFFSFWYADRCVGGIDKESEYWLQTELRSWPTWLQRHWGSLAAQWCVVVVDCSWVRCGKDKMGDPGGQWCWHGQTQAWVKRRQRGHCKTYRGGFTRQEALVENSRWELTVVEVHEINIRIYNCSKDDADTRETSCELRLKLITKFRTMIDWNF